MKRTNEEVLAEVAKLEVMLPDVKRQSVFGDDNHAAIKAQIRVGKTDLSEEACFYEYSDDHDRDAALFMRAWMDGLDDEVPSESWEPLVGK